MDIIVLGPVLRHHRFILDPRSIDYIRNIDYIYRSRLDKAVEIYLANLHINPRIIISGAGVANLGVSEAKIASWYILLEHDKALPDIYNNIVLEEKAKNTLESAIYTKLILLASGSRKPIVVSSDFHIERVKIIFDYVYGEWFQNKYVGSPTNLDSSSLNRHIEKEKAILSYTLNFFDTHGIEADDHEKILLFLLANSKWQPVK